MTTVKLFFDGASRGNPGLSGAGAYLKFSNGSIKELSKPLGRATNNQAEYRAIILGLVYLLKEYPERDQLDTVGIIGDSQLVIKQLGGEWRVNSANIRKDYEHAKQLITQLRQQSITVTLQHVPRKQNADADRLANRGADQN